MSVRLLIADDHGMIRTGLATMLAGSDIEIAAEAADGKECLKQAEQVKPDVILLDIRMPDWDGLETLDPAGEQPSPSTFSAPDRGLLCKPIPQASPFRPRTTAIFFPKGIHFPCDLEYNRSVPVLLA